MYNDTLENLRASCADGDDEIVDQLAEFAAAASAAGSGGMQVTITLEASSVSAAVHLPLDPVREIPLQRAKVLSTADVDRRLGLGDLEDVLSGSEAAAEAVTAAKARQQAGTWNHRVRRTTEAAGGEG